MQSLIIFALGLSVGSFLNVLIWRLPRGENFVKGHSRCPSCRHVLGWKDLIPLFSFIFLKRKCRYCHRKISRRYFTVELLTGIVFLALFFFTPLDTYQSWWSFGLWLSIVTLLIALTFIDFDYFIIPDKILIVIGMLGLLNIFFLDRSLNIFVNLLVGAVAGFTFFIVYLITATYYEEGGMGLGDVKLVALLGFIFGFPLILPIIYLALAGSLIGGLIIITFFKGNLRTKLPFGSFLGGSAITFIIFNKFFLPSLMPYIFKLYL